MKLSLDSSTAFLASSIFCHYPPCRVALDSLGYCRSFDKTLTSCTSCHTAMFAPLQLLSLVMDQFIFQPRYGVILCKQCAFPVRPLHLHVHIAKRHASETCRATGLDPAYATPLSIGKVAATLSDRLKAEYSLLELTSVKILSPSSTEPPFPE
jgi:hypothetical protein